MLILSDPAEIQRTTSGWRSSGASIGFVPTMGALHAGHGSLLAKARALGDRCVASIYVNPLQFGANEDLSRYPRTPEADIELCRQHGVDLVMLLQDASMYPPGFSTGVRVGALTERLEGAHRPGHFDGVATVVTKLLLLSQATAACFGEKDFQQLAVVKRMVRDLNIPCDIVACPTMREPDGLAMSSRNRYLAGDGRQQALCLYDAITRMQSAYVYGERDLAALLRRGREAIEVRPLATLEYLELVDPLSLESVLEPQPESRILVACKVRNGDGADDRITRLIDNAALGV